MASEQLVFNTSFVAGADLSAKQNCIVKISAANTVDLCGDGEGAVGVLLNDPVAGRAASVGHIGVFVTKVDGSGTAIAAGDPIQSGANGLGVKAVTDKKRVIGYAMEAATTSGALISVLCIGSSMNSI